MDWMQILSQYGFQTAACIAMAWYVYDRGEKERADRAKESERHMEEVSKLTEVIQNNTIALTRLAEKMEEK